MNAPCPPNGVKKSATKGFIVETIEGRKQISFGERE
jgi:hypothetical protein